MVAAIWSSRCSSVGRRKFITLGGAAGAGFRLVRLAVLARSNLSHMSLRSREHFHPLAPLKAALRAAPDFCSNLLGLTGAEERGLPRSRRTRRKAPVCFGHALFGATP